MASADEISDIDRDRLALALHDETDDCAFMFGRECDCSWGRKLDDALARYADPFFPKPRDEGGW